MNFRTIIDVGPSPSEITYSDKSLFAGSCFAASIGEQMLMRKMPAMINPAGTVYNPVSVSNTLENLISGKLITADDLYNNDGTWLSFYHYTDFSSDDPESLILKINDRTVKAREFLEKARFLFITFGTARVFRWKKTGIIVSNCHKVPSAQFENELLKVNDIVDQWRSLLDALSNFNPELRIVFTVSPVRHWKDGAHGNQVSKSVLFLAVEELQRHKSCPGYFPAYELLMDDLRDYRFYNDDMLHPSESAVRYIWEKYSSAYFSTDTISLQNRIMKINRALNHRFMGSSRLKKKEFAQKMLNEISEIQIRNASIDLSEEIEYFTSLI